MIAIELDRAYFIHNFYFRNDVHLIFPHAFMKHTAVVSLESTNVLSSLTTYQTNKQSELENISLHNSFLQLPTKEQRCISKKSWSAVMQLFGDSKTLLLCLLCRLVFFCVSSPRLQSSCLQMVERLKGGKRE